MQKVPVHKYPDIFENGVFFSVCISRPQVNGVFGHKYGGFLNTNLFSDCRSFGKSSGGGGLPYMGYIGICRCAGYGFQGVYFSNRVYKSERLGLEEGIFFTKPRKPGIVTQLIGKFKISRLSLNSVGR